MIWDIGAGTQLHRFIGHTDTIYQLTFSRDGSLLASGGQKHSLFLWMEFVFVVSCFVFVFPPVGGMDNCVKLWDTSIFEEKDELPKEW